MSTTSNEAATENLDFASFVKGSTPEEIQANVEKMRAILNPPSKATDKSQGYGPAHGQADDLQGYVLSRLSGG